jgi:hypothetical protein
MSDPTKLIGFATKELALKKASQARKLLPRGWQTHLGMVYDGSWTVRFFHGPVTVFHDRKQDSWCCMIARTVEDSFTGGEWRSGKYAPTPKEAVEDAITAFNEWREKEENRLRDLNNYLTKLPV